MTPGVPQLSSYTVGKGKNAREYHFVEFYLYNPDNPQERKRFQYRSHINKSKDQAERILQGNALKDLLSEYLKEGWNPFNQTPGEYKRARVGGLTNRTRNLGEVLEECYELKLKQLTGNESPRTYKYIKKNFAAWLESQFLDKVKPSAFTETHAMAYADYLTNDDKKGRSFNNYRTVIKVFFNMMIDRGLIEKNPFNRIKPARITEAEIVPFQDAELKEIREYLKEHDFNLYVYCQFIFYTLARPIELLALQVKHIDLTRNKINIPAYASKNRKSRSCNIPPALREIITGWLKYKSINDFLFDPNLEIGPTQLTRRMTATERHKEALTALKFTGKLSLYSWKYSGVISAYIAGISIEEIRLQAGHHSVEITQGYMHKLGLIKPSGFGTVHY